MCKNKRKHILAEKEDERPGRGTRREDGKRMTAAFTTIAVWTCGASVRQWFSLGTTVSKVL